MSMGQADSIIMGDGKLHEVVQNKAGIFGTQGGSLELLFDGLISGNNIEQFYFGNYGNAQAMPYYNTTQ